MHPDEVFYDPKIAISVQEGEFGDSLVLSADYTYPDCCMTYAVLHVLEISEGLIPEGELAIKFFLD